MKESVTYQAIVEEGVVQARQEALLDLGRERLGPPGPAVEMRVRGNTDPDHLNRMLKRLLNAGNWDDLLATP